MAAKTEKKILRAHWESPELGIVYLSKDWLEEAMPPLSILSGAKTSVELERIEPFEYGKMAGYFQNEAGNIIFVLWPDNFPNAEWEGRQFYIAGGFNGWEKSVGDAAWELLETELDGERCYMREIPLESLEGANAHYFKFVSSQHEWLETPADMPNCVHDEKGLYNLEFQPHRTGYHVFYFKPINPVSFIGRELLIWKEGNIKQKCTITYGDFLRKMASNTRLGSFVDKGNTHFRLFAPRATAVKVFVQKELEDAAPQSFEMQALENGVWETVCEGNLHGQFYYYSVAGENDDNFSHFDPNFKILDPYAIAAVSSEGPGIIYDFAQLPAAKREPFEPAWWHDLVIIETHVRDLLAHAPCELTDSERQGFAGLTKWLQSEDCYLRELGINAVELQPIQEFDNKSRDEYHWGYMTCNYFAPDSTYTQDPVNAGQIEEFRDLVDAFHENDIAVILDVVYNHVGEPNHLIYIDKQYYFETDPDGNLTNWSGCGNDLKCHAPMTKRLVIDSLIHLVKVYDVDGFRFDLAELIGVDVLSDIEKALKAVKPGIILIAEPWSFRGHIAHTLRHTGWSSWNDGYRDFLIDYVKGQGNFDGMRYFLQGSPFFFARFPAQTVNYTESHDDRCWLDRLTDNPDYNGQYPTLQDRRRTHLMCAVLMASLGIPMLAEGQDMLRSKHGINNTYQRGDINALNYERHQDFPQTFQYFRDWIQFRLSEWGRVLRLDYCPLDDYFKFISVEHSSALAVLYNANGDRGNVQAFFAVNPHYESVQFPLGDIDLSEFYQVADHERFDVEGLTGGLFQVKQGHLHLHAVTCGLWLKVPYEE